MERLTKKCDVITRTTASVGETEYVVKENKFGKAINKLGELEDIMEKYNIEYPNVLDSYLQTINNLNAQNTDLEQELAELKQKAIVPKEDKFVIVSNAWKHNKKYGIAKIQQVITDHYILQTNDYLGSYFPCIQYGEFKTLEEAEHKFAEVKEGKDE